MNVAVSKSISVVRVLALIVALLAAFGLVIMWSPAYASEGALNAGSFHVSTQANSGAKNTGWAKTKYGKIFYHKGKKLTGLRKIQRDYYYFSPKGIMMTEDVRIGKTRLFINPNGEVFGAQYESTYFYRTLKRMTKDDAYIFATFLKARSVMADITKPGDSTYEKMRKAYDWVNSQGYVNRRPIDASNSDWIPYQARYIFDGKGGDCHACSAALAYMFVTLGIQVDIYSTFEHPLTHCWVMVGDQVYDTLGEPDRFDVNVEETELICGAHYDVPLFSASHASKKAKPAVELLRNGIEETPWRTFNGKWFYFQKGKPATGSVKIGSHYYVFNEDGELMTGSKEGVRIVKVAGKNYQVNKRGKAVSGWSANGKRRFDKEGALLTGIQVLGSKFYVANSQGIYQKKRTKALNNAAKKGSRATVLRKLLGPPNELYYSPSCEFAGDDGLWVYDTFAVSTRRPSKVKKTINEAIKHEDLISFESIRKVVTL